MIKHSFLKYFLFVSTIILGLTACSNDTDDIMPGASQGQVRFQFMKITTWGVSELQEMKSIKLVLVKDGERVITPSLSLSGTPDSLSADLFILEQGPYKVIEYKTFGADASMLLDVELDENNEFVIEAGSTTEFSLQVKIKETIIQNNVRNALFAICKEAFGPDSANWPPTWRNANPLKNWENIEFEFDMYDNISALVGLTLDKTFAPLKKLPSSIVNLPTLESLIICDNALEELPENMGDSYITGLTIRNTNLSSFPASMSKLDLHGILLDGNKLTEYPSFLHTQKNLNLVHIYNEAITEIPAEIAQSQFLRSLNLCNLQITSLPDVFDRLFRISTLNISGNKGLTQLPSTIKPIQFGNQESYMRGLYANNCGFTSIPDEVISSKFLQLDFSGNPIQSIDKAAIESITNLYCLELNDIRFSSFPKLDMPGMRMLSLINTGLTAADVDRSGMPNLYSVHQGNDGLTYTYDFLFFTQEQYDAIFGSNLGIDLKAELLK